MIRKTKASPTFAEIVSSDNFQKEHVGKHPLAMVKYVLLLPLWWFFKGYVRHKGFMDSWQGFVFAFFSALRFPVSYIKYLKK